ncbi:hypothetical protein SAMN04487944_11184 [Gracilibacillus ureilyticus]|uniref:Uncharacterized protein n=1 Tax=Gracilibacillus ureilyticus TaxID=531814 RepID=A0A1H9SLU6_9BACI|nr:hypothetical protein [Gracilibacillus ureilyticus]SER85966.1 hypothetical protein SAMN04487944_11184 [Gracilibacillus ureilyticus]
MRYLEEHEWNLASRFLFMSMALRVIKHDLAQLQQNAPFKINEPYITLLKQIEKKATAERRDLQQQMYKEKIQVMTVEKKDSFTTYLFTCKGREEKRNYFNPAIRKKVETILNEWILNETESPQSEKKEPLSL